MCAERITAIDRCLPNNPCLPQREDRLPSLGLGRFFWIRLAGLSLRFKTPSSIAHEYICRKTDIAVRAARSLPLDTLKIDRTFISHIDTDTADEAIVRAILAMARSLDLKVVAEGVESQYQLDVLRRHGCQMAQGYYFSRPIDAVR